MQSADLEIANPQLEEKRATLPRFGQWLALITVGGFVLRLAVIVLSRGERVTGDGYEWSKQGNLNAAGHWFVSPWSLRPDASRPPGWALVLTVWAWLGQHSWFRQQLLACAIGTATVVVVGLCARRLADDRAGLVAAGIAAAYAGLWVYERALLSETLLLPEIAVMILLVYRFRDWPSLGGAAVLGGMCGVLAITRSEQVLIFPLVVIPLLLAVNRNNWRRALGWTGTAVVILLVVVVPWTIFNLGRFQRPVLLSNGFGATIAQSDCNLGYYGPETGYGDLGCLTTKVKDDQSVADSEYAGVALTYVEGHLSRLPVVVFAREGRTFGFWNPMQQTNIDGQWMGTWAGITRLAMFSYWLLLVPAVVGAVTFRRRRIALYPLMGFVVTVAIAAGVSIGDPRYRAAADVPLVLLAAVGIDAMIWRKRKTAFARRSAEPATQFDPAPSAVAVSDA